MAEDLWGTEVALTVRVRASSEELAERLVTQVLDDALSHVQERLRTISADSVVTYDISRPFHAVRESD